MVYRLLTHFFPHSVSFAISLFPTVIGAVAIFYLCYRFLLRGLAVQEARRFALSVITAYSAISLFGMATNVAFAIFGRNSPFLIG